MSLESVGKTAVGVGIAAPALAPQYITAEHIALFALFLSCLGGTYASFAWGEPVAPRSKFFRLFVSCIIIGLALSTITNAAIEWQFETLKLTTGGRCAIGAVVSCLTRFIMPAVVDSIKTGSWKSLIPYFGRKQ